MLLANAGYRQQGDHGQQRAVLSPNSSTMADIPCFKCGFDHWVRDLPRRREGNSKPRGPRWPRVPKYYDCGIENLSKKYSNKLTNPIGMPHATL